MSTTVTVNLAAHSQANDRTLDPQSLDIRTLEWSFDGRPAMRR